MRVAVTGSFGQLGQAMYDRNCGHEMLRIDLPDYDITDISAITAVLRQFRPGCIVHAAAMTDVDGCEREPDQAYHINVTGTRNIAVAALEIGCPMVYISTDYVFDGLAEQPYREYDEVNPQSTYARTKWLGEQIVRQHIARHYIVRIAWLYGTGPRNFVRTVLRLAKERGQMTMVTDEIGSPTFANDVADALYRLIEIPAYGTYHLPNYGACSRYDWACTILEYAGLKDVVVTPGTNYQRLARVPKAVALRNFMGAEVGIVMRPWKEALREYLCAG